MCRLFAQISPVPLRAEDFLVHSEFSLLKQSNFKRTNLQKDGWGIGWFGNAGEPSVSKSEKPVYKEADRFQQMAAQGVSRVVIAHIRAASNPRGLPRSRLINAESSQPFTDGRWLFAHNGTLEIPDEVAGRLGPLRRNIRTMNDSEVYFWQFVKFYGRTGDAVEALKSCIREDWEVWNGRRNRVPRKRGPYTSLNALASDGRSLYALCHSIRRGKSERAICNPGQPWQVMSLSRRGERLVVSSENLDRGRWERFDQPEIVSVDIQDGALRVRRRRFELAPLARARALETASC